MDCSLPGSSNHGILQAKILEWVAISSSRGSPELRDWVFCVGRRGSLPLSHLRNPKWFLRAYWRCNHFFPKVHCFGKKMLILVWEHSSCKHHDLALMMKPGQTSDWFRPLGFSFCTWRQLCDLGGPADTEVKVTRACVGSWPNIQQLRNRTNV